MYICGADAAESDEVETDKNFDSCEIWTVKTEIGYRYSSSD